VNSLNQHVRRPQQRLVARLQHRGVVANALQKVEWLWQGSSPHALGNPLNQRAFAAQWRV
jgi:hypothetical protein